jgi:(2R)-sulfolactate sulfo-lyase subunit beta
VAVDRLLDERATVYFGETSELTGGEHLIAQRMATPELKDKFMETYTSYVSGIEARDADLLGSQPTQGNIAGGLSTIEEKALSNIEKTGTKEIVGVLGSVGAPQDGPGLYFMDSSSATAEHVTLMAAGGAVAHLFPTGQRDRQPDSTGHKGLCQPDVDVSGLLSRELTLPEAGDLLMDYLNRTLNGRMTAAEALGHREFTMTKLYPSA